MNPKPSKTSERRGGDEGRVWRSIEEWENSPEFRTWLEREFPPGAPEWPDAMGRRQFLSLVGASLALAGFAGCSPNVHKKIVPYVDQPEQIIPGQPLIYATAMPLNGYGRGILVETQMGRPVKIEGNPAHPDSLGATDAITQAAVLELWDPDRSQAPFLQGEVSDWSDFEAELIAVLSKADAARGAGLAVLTEFSTSPTLHRQMADLFKKFPKITWYQSDPGFPIREPIPPQTDFGKLNLIVSVGSDFLIDQPASLRYSRQFAARRRVEQGRVQPNRLYVMESAPTLTGAMADHRLSAPPDRIAAVLRRLGGAMGEKLDPKEETFADNLATDLAQEATSSIVIAAETEPQEIRSLAAALGRTPSPPPAVIPAGQLEQLAADLENGKVRQLFIFGGNPVYSAPADLRFSERMAKASFTANLSLIFDETSRRCRWHLPAAHFLESWSDILASDGTPSIIQPVIEPLYGGRSVHDILSLLGGDVSPSGYDIVRMTWEPSVKDDFDAFWQQSLHDGIVKAPSPVVPTAAGNPPVAAPAIELKGDSNYLLFRPDPTIGDGRWANNGWLQELPKPLTKLTWDNAALISPAMAQRLGLKIGDVVELGLADRSVEAPVMILPGHADRCVTVHLGYGRKSAGHVGTNRGFDAGLLRTTANPWVASRLTIRKTGGRYDLACTQTHFNMEGRDIVRVADLSEFRVRPDFAAPELREEPSLLPPAPPIGNPTYSWGMTVDLSTCTGCSACVAACQAENNIAVVGKEQVAAGREMHWIRIDQYFQGTPDDPAVLHQPLLCMQCEKAPCEVVCPVAATIHNDEGLNTMVYNRCVGTRYCSNNCPYKVRRFNFLEYSPPANSSEAQRQNPNVTVRRRGVMEKCTYCIQRINEVRIAAELQDRKLRDGEILTACQQVCPAQAITFGDIQDPQSLVARRKREPVNYGLLSELNTHPRTTYLARIRNPREKKEQA
jgi:molybdopterin-containing oxidoreductase family iron-sulfur binding subunit